jgi:hypothetical protein
VRSPAPSRAASSSPSPNLDAAGLSPSEKEDLAALVEAGAGGIEGIKSAREAEFEEPLNERRLRYRRITLLPKLRPDENAPEG